MVGVIAFHLAALGKVAPCIEVRLLPSLSTQHLTAGGRLGLAEDWEISV